jgi:hypothetical protein
MTPIPIQVERERKERESQEKLARARREAEAEAESLRSCIKQLEQKLAEARKDQVRYQYVIDWLESNVIATAAFTHARTKSEYDQAIDAAIKEQQ